MHHLSQLEVDEELRMRGLLLILAVICRLVLQLFWAEATDVATATDTLAQNFTEHSWVFVNATWMSRGSFRPRQDLTARRLSWERAGAEWLPEP